jgi:hypothetical protein
VVLSRFLVVLPWGSYLRLRHEERGANVILAWGGLHGALSLALALSIPAGPQRATLLVVTYAVAAFSVAVQGLTFTPLARYLRRLPRLRRRLAAAMPVSAAYRPDPQYPALGPEFADPVAAADFPQTILRYRNDRAAATVGLDTLTDDEWIAHFGRFQPLPDNIDPPLAQRYHGHQFRVYNPDLGDGRGFTFAQLREAGAAACSTSAPRARARRPGRGRATGG